MTPGTISLLTNDRYGITFPASAERNRDMNTKIQITETKLESATEKLQAEKCQFFDFFNLLFL